MPLSLRLILLSLILIPCLNACSPVNGVRVIRHDIQVAEFTADVTQSVAAVEGQAQNTLWWPLDESRICVTFYDYGGNSLGVFSDSIKRLDAGQVWNFRVALKGGDAWKVARYEVSICN
jgi:hypothetical protein